MTSLPVIDEEFRAQYKNSHIWEDADNNKNSVVYSLLSFLHQKLAERDGEILREINGKLTVYYRSKFSQDCSRGETEEEKKTEMIALDDLCNLIRKENTN